MKTYYNKDTEAEVSVLPALPDVSNADPVRDWNLWYDRGWREVIPFVVPEGYVKHGSREIVMTDDEAHEVCEVWTQAEEDVWQAEQAAAAIVARKAVIAAALADPVDAVIIKAIKFLGANAGFAEQQINAKFVEWIEEVVAGA